MFIKRIECLTFTYVNLVQSDSPNNEAFIYQTSKFLEIFACKILMASIEWALIALGMRILLFTNVCISSHAFTVSENKIWVPGGP